MITTPGVYFQQVDRGRPSFRGPAAIAPLRTDIAGILGYAERGPLLVPVKVTSWRQFTTVFGDPLPFAFLPEAVRGFFDNGGAACYVVRVADPDSPPAHKPARAAEITLAGSNGPPPPGGAPALRLWASHGELTDPVTQSPRVDAAGRPIRYDSPGAWGNRLSVSWQNSSGLPQAAGGSTRTDPAVPQPLDGWSSFVQSLVGFDVGAVVQLSQNGVTAYRQVAARDPLLRQLTWNAPLAGFNLSPGAPDILLQSVEFTLLVHLDGQIAERHETLSLSAAHPRYLLDWLRANSNLLDAELLLDPDAGDLLDPTRWPAEVEQMPLSAGSDGLSTVNKTHFLTGLAALADVDEVSLLAAPDLVLPPQELPQNARAQSPASSCEVIAPPPAGRLRGLVTEEDNTPVAGVQVVSLGQALPPTFSDNDGKFQLTGLPVGQVSLLLTRSGYHDLEVTAQATTILPLEPAHFFLTPVSLPPAFSPDEVYEVQSAMLQQGHQGLYRVAVLDPPASMLGLEEIQTWRTRFDTPFAALYYPWLRVSDQGDSGAVRDVPPSGHVLGLIARTDLSQGVHRAPANDVLHNVKALTHDVNDAVQGILNPQGINCIRALPGRGLRVYGARTLSSDAEWRYLNVRRLVLMIEEAIEEYHQWAVFEPNNQVLRQSLTYSLNSFLNLLWRRGALAGKAPDAAYRVKCDADNNPPAIVDAGQIVAEIAVAPTIPFEFIIFRLGRTVEAVEVTE